MKRTRLLAGLAGGLGTATILNRLLRVDTEPESPLGRERSTYRWRRFDIAYTTAGDPSDPDLLLCHGINAAGSSAEFRYVVDALSETYHVIAPDLPGFGASDRPAISYDGSMYVDFLSDFVRDRTEHPVVVTSSLSGAYAVAAAGASDLDIERFVLVCPTATTIPGRRGWLRSLFRTPVLGETLYNVLVSKPAIRYFLADHGVANTAAITDEWVEYDWKTAHRPGGRFVTASFVGGFLDLDTDLGVLLDRIDVPTTLVWGADAAHPTEATGRELAERGGCRFVVFENAALLVHAEHPAEFVDLIRSERPDHESSIETGVVDGGP
jgi:pimeloyl-ACP methyl ester carboxylesterase